MSGLLSYLPQTEGLLPKWMFFIASVSLFNSVQCYIGGEKLNRRVYERQPSQVTGLSSRTFGTWTIIASVIRLYAAYRINERSVYEITFATYLVAGFHFLTEWLVFKTAKFGKGLLGPLVVSSVTTIWMINQWNYYVDV